jgi:hypothetical protein|tara:strand:+ start:1646 stop:2548 length:903 start_codon:yes stop_codon:yes gene_type:complete
MINVQEVLNSTETNFTVSKYPAFSIINGEKINTSSYNLHRDDTGQFFCSVGDRYTVMQNEELASILVTIQNEFGGEFASKEISGGTLGKKGDKVFYQLALPDGYVNDEVLKRNITTLNGHNNRNCIGFGATNTVVSCSNMFHMAMKDLTKIRHTATASEKLALVATEFKNAMMGEKMIMDTYKIMSEIKSTPHVKETLKKIIMKDAYKAISAQGGDKSKISTRMTNKLVSYNNSIVHELNAKGDSIWGLFNGVTYFTNHKDTKVKDINNLMVGRGYKANKEAFDYLSNYATEKKSKLVTI